MPEEVKEEAQDTHSALEEAWDKAEESAKEPEEEVEVEAKAEEPSEEKPEEKVEIDAKPEPGEPIEEETKEAEEKPEPLDAPHHWTVENQEMFRKLDPEAQSFLMDRDKVMEAAHTKRSQEIAPLRNAAEKWAPYLSQMQAEPSQVFDTLMQHEYGLRTRHERAEDQHSAGAGAGLRRQHGSERKRRATERGGRSVRRHGKDTSGCWAYRPTGATDERKHAAARLQPATGEPYRRTAEHRGFQE